MTEPCILSVEPGDALFLYNKSLASFFSPTIQAFIDSHAQGAGLRFSHVALAVTTHLAIEAVPADNSGNGIKGPWSDEVLGDGVRIIPLGDLIGQGSGFAVLRSPCSPFLRSRFNLRSNYYDGILGSTYSLDRLKQSAEIKCGKLAERLGSRIKATSPANSIADLLATTELRASIETSLPNYRFLFESNKFFCSDLIAQVLLHEDLLTGSYINRSLTPIGLFQVLSSLQWQDVTASSYSRIACKKYLDEEKTHAVERFATEALFHRLNKQLLATAETTRFIQATFDSMNALCDDIMKQLPKT